MGPGTSLIQLGFATYGSDSGHQMAFGMGFGRGRSGEAAGWQRRLPVPAMIGL